MTTRILFDPNLLYEQSEQHPLMHWFAGKTTIVQNLGFNQVSRVIGPYTVLASANKYLAKIIRTDYPGKPQTFPLEKQPSQEIFFSGNITIYQEGISQENTVLHNYLKLNGEIKTAVPSEDRYLGPLGLERLIFTGDTSEPIDSIQEIITMYKELEK